jgi:hypothetical protein
MGLVSTILGWSPCGLHPPCDESALRPTEARQGGVKRCVPKAVVVSASALRIPLDKV